MENHLEMGKLIHRLRESGNYQFDCIVHSKIQRVFFSLAALGPLVSAQAPLVVASGGCSLVAVRGLLTVAASLVAQHRLSGA